MVVIFTNGQGQYYLDTYLPYYLLQELFQSFHHGQHLMSNRKEGRNWCSITGLL